MGRTTDWIQVDQWWKKFANLKKVKVQIYDQLMLSGNQVLDSYAAQVQKFAFEKHFKGKTQRNLTVFKPLCCFFYPSSKEKEHSHQMSGLA